MGRLTQVTLAVALISGQGCYRLEPVTLDAVPQGSKIRAVLSPAASDQLRLRHGIDGRQLDATVLAIQGAAVSLWVASVPLSREFGAGPLYQQVDVLKSDILRVDRRELDGSKTAFVAVGGAAVLGAVARATFLGPSGSSNNGGGGVPPESRRRWLPFLVVRF